MKRIVPFILAVAMMTTLLSSCGDAKDTGGGKQTTLKMMLPGSEPNKMSEVLDEFYRRTADTLNVKLDIEWSSLTDHKEKLKLKMAAGEECDLVFDAPWQTLRQFINDGAYQPLEEYFNNPKYPGLQKSFAPDIIEAHINPKHGHLYVVPVMRALGAGLDCVVYRQDLADKYGIGEIDSYDKLQQFLEAIRTNEPSMVPIGLTAHRGFFHMFEEDAVAAFDQNVLLRVNPGNNLFLNILLADDQKSVKAVAAFGDPDSAYAEFPEPYNTDPLMEEFVKKHEWNRYTEMDSINQKDSQAIFLAGKAAAYIDVLDAYETIAPKLSAAIPEARMGTFIYVDRVRNKEKGAVLSGFTANNSVAIPITSKKADKTMEFLDWLFTNEENHDLFELGVEGVHWKKEGEDRYSIPEGVDPVLNYNFPGWPLTWNPNYVRFSEIWPEKELEYKKYEFQSDTYRKNITIGFTFDPEPVKVELARLKPIIDEVLVPLHHGILENPVEVKRENTKKLRENGLNEVEAEYVKQLNEFLQSR